MATPLTETQKMVLTYACTKVREADSGVVLHQDGDARYWVFVELTQTFSRNWGLIYVRVSKQAGELFEALKEFTRTLAEKGNIIETPNINLKNEDYFEFMFYPPFEE